MTTENKALHDQAQIALYRTRLLNVVRALRESPAPHRFSMSYWNHFECGTPACALGHYAARRDLQDVFCITRRHNLDCWVFDAMQSGDATQPGGDHTQAFVMPVAMEHFGLDDYEFAELFGAIGCNNAKTPEAAARYIEQFVERRWPITK